MLTDKFSLGLNSSFSTFIATYSDGGYDYEVALPIIRIMPKANLHYGNSDAFDGYFGLEAGFRNISATFTTDDPDFTEDDVENTSSSGFAWRVETGVRYFFSDAIGMNMELGIGGGAILAAGLSIRL